MSLRLIYKYQRFEQVHVQARRGTQHVPPKCYRSIKLQRFRLPEGSNIQRCMYKCEF
jgi:hypothetical protein